METNPLSVTSFANIFSQSVGCLLALFIVPFAVQKLLSLNRPHLFIFYFYFYYSRRWIEKDVAVIYVRECFTYGFFFFPSRSFIMPSLTFRSLTYFELIFLYEVKKWSIFIFLHVRSHILNKPSRHLQTYRKMGGVF